MNVSHLLLSFALVASSLVAESTAQSPVRLTIASPLDYQVMQRTTASEGRLIVAGGIRPASRDSLPVDAITARITGRSLFGDLPGQWTTLPFDPRVADFRGELIVPAGGWYRMEVRALRAGIEVSAAIVEHIGVGEVFVVAGQSNAANYGEELQTTQTGRVAAFDGTGWQLANDPQPGAGGTKGRFHAFVRRRLWAAKVAPWVERQLRSGREVFQREGGEITQALENIRTLCSKSDQAHLASSGSSIVTSLDRHPRCSLSARCGGRSRSVTGMPASERRALWRNGRPVLPEVQRLATRFRSLGSSSAATSEALHRARAFREPQNRFTDLTENT